MMSDLREERPTILVVGGWSPGPLIYLSSILASYKIVQPEYLPMPPIPGSWCYHPMVLLMFLVCGLLLWFSCQKDVKLVWKLLSIVGTVAMIRVLVAVVVRTSIETAVNSCLEVMRPY